MLEILCSYFLAITLISNFENKSMNGIDVGIP